MITCLIFGGNGFIGSHLAESLIEKGYVVKVFDNYSHGMHNLDTFKDKVEIIHGSFLNDDDVCKALKNVDYIFHYISTTIPSTAKINPVYDIETNIIGSVKLIKNALNTNVSKFIFSSSGGTVYGQPKKLPVGETNDTNPLDPYGISKLAIEKYLFYFNQTYGLDYRILRYSNPYGERQNPSGIQGVIPIFLNKIRLGEKPIIYGDGTTIRDYIYIKDAVAATIAVLEQQSNNKIFNVGSGEGKSLNELVGIISKVIGKPVLTEYVKDNGKSIREIILDISTINKQTGWKPLVTLEDGISRTWQWLNSM